MRWKATIKPISYVKTHTAELVQQINQTRQAVIVTQNGEPRAVMQDVETFEETRRALLLLKLAAQGEAEIRGGRAVDQATAFAAIEARRRRG